MSYVATRLQAVKPSASMAASMAAKALRATGIDVIDLGLGEPDFPTWKHVCEALALVEQIAKPGVSCRAIYAEVQAWLATASRDRAGPRR